MEELKSNEEVKSRQQFTSKKELKSNVELTLKEENHHKQLQLCTTRPAYRQGRKLTAIKVYTINNESPHLFIYGVPKIKLRSELKNLCSKYGQVVSIHVAGDYKTEIFTECYHVNYDRIQSARVAKRLIDNRSFYGGVLHVCYAPEFETVQETRQKLLQRDRDVLTRLPKFEGPQELPEQSRNHTAANHNKGNPKRKRKREEYMFPDIYAENDPILKSIGPEIPRHHTENVEEPIIAMEKDCADKKVTTSLIPTQVKRIVFRKKKVDDVNKVYIVT